MSKEAMNLALEALEHVIYWDNEKPEWEYAHAAITALREALAEQPAQQEPVAWMHVMDNTEGLKANGTGIVSITQKRKQPFGKPGVDFSKSYPVTSTPLYTEDQLREYVKKAVEAERAKRKPLTLWTEAQHERAYRNSPELHKDVKSLAAFKRVAKEIAAMYGIKENT